MDFLDRKYRHIFVDFDSTLYLWDNSPGRKPVDDIEWAARRLSNSEQNYDEKCLNVLLIEYLKQTQAQIHLTSWVDFSFEAKAKFDFIEEIYPNLLTDYIGTASTDAKIKLLRVYERLGNPKESMLLIDDNCNVVRPCRAAGYDVQEPQFIMGEILKYANLQKL